MCPSTPADLVRMDGTNAAPRAAHAHVLSPSCAGAHTAAAVAGSSAANVARGWCQLMLVSRRGSQRGWIKLLMMF